MNYETPCIEAVVETFSSMCGVTPVIDGDTEQLAAPQTFKTDEILGIVGLSGEKKGDIMVTMNTSVAQSLVGAFIMEEIPEVNVDLLDGYGELLNIIAGSFSAKLEDVKFELALPTVMAGEHQTHIRENIKCFVIPLKFPEWGEFKVIILMEEL